MFLVAFFLLYQALQIIFAPAILLYFIVRFFKKKSLGSWCERFGFVPRTKIYTCRFRGGPRGEGPTSPRFILWIHAISVGEVLSIEHFITMCKRKHPNLICYLTCGTTTGMQVAKKLGADYVSFMPFDFLIPMLLAFKRINPSALVIVEAEIWPNFLMLAHFKKIPLYLLNGRINPTSAHKRRFIGFLYKLFTSIFAPSERAAEQFKSIGIPSNNISVLGDIKAFNVVEKQKGLTIISPTFNNTYTVILAGSIHAAELDIYLSSYLKLKLQIPNLRLILAPRHFHWQQELINKLIALNITYTLWEDKTPTKTSLQELGATITDTFTNHEVLVVCKLGVLFSLYPFATIYCLGGTFIPVGGHNLLEPAVWAKPCLIGPYYHMCFDVAEQLHIAGGLIKTTSAKELQDAILNLAHNQALCSQMGKANATWITLQAKNTKAKLGNFIKNIGRF